MKNRLALTGILPLIVLLAVPVTAALADCDPGGNIGGTGDDSMNCTGTTNTPIVGDLDISDAGDDTITNSGDANSGIIGDAIAFGTGGNDTITNNGNVQDGIVGDAILLGLGGNDNITNNGNVDGVIVGDAILLGLGGNDTITNNGTVEYGIHGDLIGLGSGGDDTITNNGTVEGHITGDIVVLGPGIVGYPGIAGGNDTIINAGTVEGGIHGDLIGLGQGGDDLIIVTGTVGRSVNGDVILLGRGGDDVIIIDGHVEGDVNGDVLLAGVGGNDSVVIRDRSTVNGIINGDFILITGQGGNQDSLHLDMKQREATAEEYLWFLEYMENADPASGSVCWMGDCYTWLNFERLSWQLNYNFGPLPYYFMDIPAYELPVYGAGSAPHCSFYSAQHGPKWIDPEECEDFDPAQVDLVCLNRYGMWDSEYVSGVGPTEDGKLHFTTIQHGVCSIFPKS